MMNIVAFLGSSSTDSLTRQGLQAVLDDARKHGIVVDVIDLRDQHHTLQNMQQWDQPPAGSQTAQLRERVARADGVVLATPVYHGSFSGLLKNALDQLTGDAFAQRPVGLLAAAGGPRSGSSACDQLRCVVRAMGGWATPTHVGLSGADIVDGHPTDSLRRRAAVMVAELRSFVMWRSQLQRAA
jgi:NAD(P)H-dependent FMN reductase